MGSLEEVHMPQNGINHPGVTALATAMQHNASLRILNLNDNTFTEKGAIAMAQVLTVKFSLTKWLLKEMKNDLVLLMLLFWMTTASAYLLWANTRCPINFIIY